MDGQTEVPLCSTVLHFYSLTVLQFDSSTVLVLQFYSSTVLQSTVLQFVLSPGNFLDPMTCFWEERRHKKQVKVCYVFLLTIIIAIAHFRRVFSVNTYSRMK